MKLFDVLLAALAFAGMMFVEATPLHGVERAEHTDYNLPHPIVPLYLNTTYNGVHIEGTGSLDEIFAKVLVEHPGFKLPERNNSTKGNSGIERRYGYGALYCIPVPGWSWVPVNMNTAWSQMNFLMQLGPLQLTIPAFACIPIVLNGNAQVWNLHTINPPFEWYGDLGYQILNNCGGYDAATDLMMVGGQQFDVNGFDLIIRQWP
ncbi:uncharacterized protein LY89DRAFT_742676 [Mollisia scopiformis]|uniref:Uncharacterized protein n=1 Tax=Mollisia scopiformis TaxID=149040 RepID=A0A132B678_MOLSC|nr:uncharacterized protein LY89DRAFT_742676 [Mollisia scopiformis]KUJ07915.1 hypothetical protein LY89DRAFT_742676 [Mollisia scopiformis]